MSTFDESFDFVVVGCGGGGLCASLVMRDAGKSVVVLEKTALAGGTTAKSGGVMWIPNNRFMKRDGVEDSAEKALTYLENTAGRSSDAPGATRARFQAYVAKAPEMVEFLIKRGVKLNRVSYWPDYYDELPGGVKEGRTVVAEIFNLNELGEWKDKLRPGFIPFPASLEEALEMAYVKQSWRAKQTLAKIAVRFIAAKIAGRQYVSAGAALQGRTLKAALEAGADIRLSAPVNQLIVEDGRVSGVMTEKDGKPWRVGARLGVLINAGGFARNQAMRDRFQPGTRAAWSNTAEGDTGEMILEMQRLGAQIAQMEEMVGYQSAIPPGAEDAYIKPGAQGLTAKPHAVLVDQSGVRYLNEGGSYALYCKNMLERNKSVPAVPSWAIFDSQYVKKYPLANVAPGKPWPERWAQEGFVRQGQTVEALASALKIEATTLRATLDRFNGFVDRGKDEDFGRGGRAYDNWLGDKLHMPSATLGRIDVGPFYAVPIVPGDVGTYGGAVTDEKARVLREDGTPIEGLYATGVSTASVMGRAYVGAGASVGPSYTWGYVAARHAANLDSQPV
jgi:3-oxosteroid 1-dehydrogenase